MQYVVAHEGQSIPVPAEIGADEQKLRRALSTIIPGIAEAKITSTVKDDLTTFTIIKTAGTKGAGHASPLAALAQCEGGINPAVAYFQSVERVDLTSLSPDAALRMDAQISEALVEGQEQFELLEKALARLAASAPIASPRIVLGF